METDVLNLGKWSLRVLQDGSGEFTIKQYDGRFNVPCRDLLALRDFLNEALTLETRDANGNLISKEPLTQQMLE
jgi:hypothetical protein